MKNFILFTILYLVIGIESYANNLVLGTPSVSGSTVSFTIKWNNSWRVTAAPSNWDAIWVFVKRQHCDANTQSPWMHETLSNSNHSVTGSQLEVNLATSDNLGVFIRRSAQGIGDITQATVSLTLSSPIGTDNISVYGIEMVYVPQGQFYIGDGNAGMSGFSDGTSNNPKLITAAIQSAGIGPVTNYNTANWAGSTVDLPSTFPLGYNGFYCMKYEITCKLYISFLNSLTYGQQIRLLDNPYGAPTLASPGDKINTRYGYNIEVKSQSALQPAVYGCDATDDDNWDQIDDGVELPVCLRTQNLTAFLDWAALRPMTEFEYEKSCRGPVYPVYNEFAWGTTEQSNNYTIVDRFKTSERSTTTPLGFSNIYTNQLFRVGIEATATSDRSHAGASYYGILNLTGSTSERCVGGWQYDYSNFTTANGDGNISIIGTANVTGWPSGRPESYSTRGGSARDRGESIFVSDRRWASLNDDYYYIQGGRGVRSY